MTHMNLLSSKAPLPDNVIRLKLNPQKRKNAKENSKARHKKTQENIPFLRALDHAFGHHLMFVSTVVSTMWNNPSIEGCASDVWQHLYYESVREQIENKKNGKNEKSEKDESNLVEKSHNELANSLNLSKRTIQRHVHSLIQNQYLEITHQYSGQKTNPFTGKQRKTTIFVFQVRYPDPFKEQIEKAREEENRLRLEYYGEGRS